MNPKKNVYATMIALLLFTLTFERAFACGWNPLCHLSKALIGDPLNAAIPEIKGKLTFKIEDVHQLRSLVRTTARNVESVIQVTGGETRLTMETAQRELAEYTRLLDEIVANRLGQIDEIMTAKLQWIAAYTQQLNESVQEIIQVTSKEVQTVVTVTSNEAQAILAAGGVVMQDTIRVTGEEMRFSMRTASGEIQEIVTKVSSETQIVMTQATEHINDIIAKTTEGLERLIQTTEDSSLVILEGVLYMVVRTADLALALGATAAGLTFFFVAAYGWGRALLKSPLPEAFVARVLVYTLMVITFLAALLPFGFLSKEARAYALLPMNQAQVYQDVVGDWGERLTKPKIQQVTPNPLFIQPDQSMADLVVSGRNLWSMGEPQARFGDHELLVTGSDTELRINLSPLVLHREAAPYIELRFGNTDAAVRRVAVLYAETEAASATTTTTSSVALSSVQLTVTVSPGGKVRSGPGTIYPTVGGLTLGETREVIGYNREGEQTWWVIVWPAVPSAIGWIADSVVTVTGDFTALTSYPAPPAPLPTATPAPVATNTPQPTPTPDRNAPLALLAPADGATIVAPTYVVLQWQSIYNGRVTNEYYDIKLYDQAATTRPYSIIGTPHPFFYFDTSAVTCGHEIYWSVQVAYRLNGPLPDHDYWSPQPGWDVGFSNGESERRRFIVLCQ